MNEEKIIYRSYKLPAYLLVFSVVFFLISWLVYLQHSTTDEFSPFISLGMMLLIASSIGFIIIRFFPTIITVDFPTTGNKDKNILLSKNNEGVLPATILTPPLLTYDADRHLITFAPNGSGKFTTTQAPVLLSLDRSIFCIDPKGQAAAVTGRRRQKMGQKVVFLNPFGLHGLPKNTFNPLATLKPESPSFLADVSRLVDGLIDQGGKDPFWAESARDLFSWLIMWTILKEESKTLARVRDLLCLPPSALEKLAIEAADVNYPPLQNKAAGYIELSPTLNSVIKTAQAETRIFDDPLIRESLSGEDFDFSELKEQKTTVYLILPADYLALYSKWLRVLLMSAMSAMYRRHDGERVLFLLDEFAQLGYLYDLEKAAGLARGYRVQLWPFFQDLNQLKSLYGDRWETFLANAGVIQVFTPNDLTTAHYFSARNKKESDSELLEFDERKQLIFRNGKKSGIELDKTQDYYKNPDFAGMFDPDPFHLE